jgi:poly(beta-D-mannuronate) lyase
VEIVSIKSCDNIISNNTFFECEGSLVLRHGNHAVVFGNWFLGNGKEFTGGVRIVNEGHLVYNNFFYKLRGDGFRAALSIMNAIPNSAANGYAPVRNVVVSNNTYYDCTVPWAFGVGLGERNRIVKPESTLLLNNLVYCPGEETLIRYFDQTDGITLHNNQMIGKNGSTKDAGTVEGNVQPSRLGQVEFVYSDSKAKKLPYVKYDILGQLREDPVIGAFQNKGEQPVVERATSMNCGPAWYQPKTSFTTEKKQPTGNIIQIPAGKDILYQAIKKAKAGDVCVLEEGIHTVSRKMTIKEDVTIQAASNAKTKPVLTLVTDKPNGCLFELTGNATLTVDGIALDGNSLAAFPAKYAFISSKEKAFGYSLYIRNCEIYGFNVATGAVFKAYKGSFADVISLDNSIIRDSYRGFSLREEVEDIGKYNADNLVFNNSVFKNITQYAVDYYRGGNDESTLGGSFVVNHCVFDAVADDEKQTILKLTGIVHLDIQNSIFCSSSAKLSVRLSGEKNSVKQCCFYECVPPKVEKGANMQNLISVNPKFQKKSYELSATSPLKGKATDKGNIGLR